MRRSDVKMGDWGARAQRVESSRVESTSRTFFNLYQEGIKKTRFPGENPLIALTATFVSKNSTKPIRLLPCKGMSIEGNELHETQPCPTTTYRRVL